MGSGVQGRAWMGYKVEPDYTRWAWTSECRAESFFSGEALRADNHVIILNFPRHEGVRVRVEAWFLYGGGFPVWCGREEGEE